jgi:hypothetical protein
MQCAKASQVSAFANGTTHLGQPDVLNQVELARIEKQVCANHPGQLIADWVPSRRYQDVANLGRHTRQGSRSPRSCLCRWDGTRIGRYGALRQQRADKADGHWRPSWRRDELDRYLKLEP